MNVQRRHSRATNGRYRINNVPIFMVHQRGDQNYSESRLISMVENTKRSRRNPKGPKVFVSHSGERRPVMARLARDTMRVVCGVVYADIVNMKPAFFQSVVDDTFPQWSVELNPLDLGSIEGLAFLGADESYFPFQPIDIELTPEEQLQLQADIQADATFQFGRNAEEEYVGAATLYTLGRPKSAMPKLYAKNDKGEFVDYELQPTDLQGIGETFQQAIMPMMEGMAALSMKMDAVMAVLDMTEETNKAAGMEGDGSEAEAVADAAADSQDGGEMQDSKREMGDAEDDAESKRSRQAQDAIAETAKDIELAKLRNEARLASIRSRLEKAIDPRVHANAKELVDRAYSRILACDSSVQEHVLTGIVSAHENQSAPKGVMYAEETSETGDKYAQAAKEWNDNRTAVGLAPLANGDNEKLAKFWRERPESMPKVIQDKFKSFTR